MTDIEINHIVQAGSDIFDQLRASGGQMLTLAPHQSVLLDDPTSAYLVTAGTVDLFGLRLREGVVIAPRRHILRVDSGGIFFGFEADSTWGSTRILAVGLPGTGILRVSRDVLRELASDPSQSNVVAALLDEWVVALTSGIARDIAPKGAVLLAPDRKTNVAVGAVALPRDGVIWVRSGGGVIVDRSETGGECQGSLLPLTRHFWLRATEPVVLSPCDTTAFFRHDPSWAGLTRFHSLAAGMIADNQAQDELTEREQLKGQIDSDREVVCDALDEIAGLLAPEAVPARVHASETNALIAATELVGHELGLDLHDSLAPLVVEEQAPNERELAHAAHIRVREVVLKDRWWQLDAGPILARRREDNHPVALLPDSARRYTMHDPVASTQTRVTAEVAATLAPRAHVFYRPLPRRSLTLGDLVRFGLFRSWRDLGAILALGVGTGLAGVATPIATQRIFDDAIPAHDQSQLLGIAFLLLAITIAGALLQIARGIAVLRLTSKLDGKLQAALWDRLLNLPAPFFRRFTAGDLGNRALGITIIRDLLAGTVTTTILSAFFSFFNLALLFYYSPQLALVSIGLVTIAVVAYVATGAYQVRFQRQRATIEGRIAGFVLQLLGGLEKFRVTGGEGRAFSLWATAFREQRHRAEQARQVESRLLVFNAAYPILATLAIFADVALTNGAGLTSGRFIAFTAAFTQVLTNALGVGATLVAVVIVIPIFERARPILRETPEVDEGHLDPGELSGAIDLHHVSFRYGSESSLALDDLSIIIRPGEFVALVGPSGSGKSTIFRLLLGFERPESGGVFYDSQDLAGLDVHDVRHQIGTVLQNGRVLRGTLLENIIGSSRLTIEDAWAAAHLAGLDEDIRTLPLGMHTLISEESGTFSGGQRQRLMIARALVHRPRIVLFDEATSALDNATQEIVSASMSALHATRIVIAHRLTTIIQADTIYVLEAGRIVQHGSYEELVRQPGLFAELAQRQLA